MLRFLLALSFFVICSISYGLVNYDGRIEVNGITLFQDSEKPNFYYYLPPYPRISILENGDFEFMCTKYVGQNGKESSGGLFHALIQFSLSKEEVAQLEVKLKEKFPKAILMGPVAMDASDKADMPSFRIISSILQEGNSFTSSIISSGVAPLMPGSKAAIAALLKPDGATLLWDSFQGGTSDVSVVVEGHILAKVKAFKATIKANLELVYNHLSTFHNVQRGFKKVQIQDVLDSLHQSGMIQIDVADMSAGLNINTEVYQNLLNIITERVVDMMFDVETGWAKMPTMERGAQGDVPGRYKRGAFVRFFAGDGAQPYIPDDQFVLKKREEIRSFHFFLDLNQSTVIKVPIYAAGNLRGFYNEYKDNKKYFRVVDMNDPDFQVRDIRFQIDGSFINSFGEIIDQVSVLVEKDYQHSDNNSFNGSLMFNKTKLDSGEFIQALTYQRLGDRSNQWLEYKYKVGWKFIGIDSVITVPAHGWDTTDLAALSLQPPLKKTNVEIGIDKSLLKDAKIQSARIRFASILFGKPYKGKMMVIRTGDSKESYSTTIYHDKDQPIVYQVNWYTNQATTEDDLAILQDDYLFLVPPQNNEN